MVTVQVPDGVAAGSTVIVQYQPVQPVAFSGGRATAPPGPAMVPNPPAAQQPGAINAGLGSALPMLPVSTATLQDERDAGRNWAIYSAGWLLCCCSFVVPLCWLAPVIWTALAAIYYCKPPQQRALIPRQRGPALASLVTCAALAALLVVAGLCAVALGVTLAAQEMEHHHHWKPPSNHNFHAASFGGTLLNGTPQQQLGLLQATPVLSLGGPPGTFQGLALANGRPALHMKLDTSKAEHFPTRVAVDQVTAAVAEAAAESTGQRQVKQAAAGQMGAAWKGAPLQRGNATLVV